MCRRAGLARLPTRLGLVLLRAYQIGLSPILYAFGVRCRHQPSCSSYATDCVREQGLWRGSWLAAGRVLRCRPGGSWGYDPAPEPRPKTAWWKVWALREGPVRDRQGYIHPAGETPDGE
ncbi:membrane protein insertion efficiency factor YidD [Oceanicaulis sp.]|uniref:membrane protein insertion efficiency factor YidD n=1 Tax=Oceanicaulis sp. TaxID=1924941 RepID=UPI003BA9BBBF